MRKSERAFDSWFMGIALPGRPSEDTLMREDAAGVLEDRKLGEIIRIYPSRPRSCFPAEAESLPTRVWS